MLMKTHQVVSEKDQLLDRWITMLDQPMALYMLRGIADEVVAAFIEAGHPVPEDIQEDLTGADNQLTLQQTMKRLAAVVYAVGDARYSFLADCMLMYAFTTYFVVQQPFTKLGNRNVVGYLTNHLGKRQNAKSVEAAVNSYLSSYHMRVTLPDITSVVNKIKGIKASDKKVATGLREKMRAMLNNPRTKFPVGKREGADGMTFSGKRELAGKTLSVFGTPLTDEALARISNNSYGNPSSCTDMLAFIQQHDVKEATA